MLTTDAGMLSTVIFVACNTSENRLECFKVKEFLREEK